eukprot:TRINITY_DN672_c0_g1_i5.p1 TRINITY_DN672_c0_g1~~TRINITY_DN672_c0_g1_i5.p1  ORF type:complete len:212 (-),score=3.98 TRINITY_DN672_c0_g1_i5:92-727(-)
MFCPALAPRERNALRNCFAFSSVSKPLDLIFLVLVAAILSEDADTARAIPDKNSNGCTVFICFSLETTSRSRQASAYPLPTDGNALSSTDTLDWHSALNRVRQRSQPEADPSHVCCIDRNKHSSIRSCNLTHVPSPVTEAEATTDMLLPAGFSCTRHLDDPGDDDRKVERGIATDRSFRSIDEEALIELISSREEKIPPLKIIWRGRKTPY